MMALTPSNMLALGTIAPNFNLPDVSTDQMVDLDTARGKHGTLVMFICNHCPYVIHIQEALTTLCNEYQQKSIGVIAINANDINTYPDDSPDRMRDLAQTLGFNFPYCYDESQAIARAYLAACTPDFFLFDANLQCVYRGQFDDARPGNNQPVDGHDLRHALDCLIQGKTNDHPQRPSIGCNIKWR